MKLKGCRLTEKQQDRLVEFFVGEMTARTAADLVGINKTTGAYFFHRLRAIIAWQLDEASPLAGEVEADESYFGGKRKGKRGRGAADYLQKPFNPTLLRARLGASLEKKHLRDQEKSYLDQIKIEKKKSDDLLTVILPGAVASELKATGKVQPRGYDNVANLFCDIVGFTTYCTDRSPEEVVSGLQVLFTRFEEITAKYSMEKIKTIGDEFMGTSTVPDLTG